MHTKERVTWHCYLSGISCCSLCGSCIYVSIDCFFSMVVVCECFLLLTLTVVSSSHGLNRPSPYLLASCFEFCFYYAFFINKLLFDFYSSSQVSSILHTLVNMTRWCELIAGLLMQVCLMLVSRAKSEKKQSSDVATFKVDFVTYMWPFVALDSHDLLS